MTWEIATQTSQELLTLKTTKGLTDRRSELIICRAHSKIQKWTHESSRQQWKQNTRKTIQL